MSPTSGSGTGTPLTVTSDAQYPVTLFDLTYWVASQLNLPWEGLATGGSATTLIDTNRRTEPDDYWNLGTVWILKDAGGAGAAPQAEYAEITDFELATNKATFTTLTAAVGAGDKYAIATDAVPLQTIVQKINNALMDIHYPVSDTTTVVIVDDTTEYTLPVGADVREVWVQTNDDSNDNVWMKVYNWEIGESAAGVGDTLILPYQFDPNYTCKIVYVTRHADLVLAADKLHENIPPILVVYKATLACYEWLKARHRSQEWDSEIAVWLQRVDKVERERRIKLPRRDGRIGIVRTQGDLVPDDEPNKVYL